MAFLYKRHIIRGGPSVIPSGETVGITAGSPFAKAIPAGSLNISQAFTAGWATFGQVAAEGSVPAGSGIQVGSLLTQTDIKTTWPDGSMRFGIVTTNIPSDGTYTVASQG